MVVDGGIFLVGNLLAGDSRIKVGRLLEMQELSPIRPETLQDGPAI